MLAVMSPGPKAARELLAFYLDSGADAVIGEEPVDRMADDTAAPRLGADPVASPHPWGRPPRRRARGVRLRRSHRASNPPPQPRPRKAGGSTTAPATPDAAVMAAREAARNAADAR